MWKKGGAKAEPKAKANVKYNPSKILRIPLDFHGWCRQCDRESECGIFPELQFTLGTPRNSEFSKELGFPPSNPGSSENSSFFRVRSFLQKLGFSPSNPIS